MVWICEDAVCQIWIVIAIVVFFGSVQIQIIIPSNGTFKMDT